MNPHGTIAPVESQIEKETGQNVSLSIYPYSRPTNTTWISEPTPIILPNDNTFAYDPTQNLAISQFEMTLTNSSTNSVDPTAQYSSVVSSTPSLDNPWPTANNRGEDGLTETLDPYLAFTQPIQPSFPYSNGHVINNFNSPTQRPNNPEWQYLYPEAS